MIKHLTVHGNSLALLLDKAILELLGITRDTALKLSTDGINLVVTPLKEKNKNNKLKKALKKVNKNHSETLATLAK